MTKYRALFLEEATEHLAEMSRALLVLEKDSEAGDAIETLFRMAHSIKSMAASLDYTSIAELSHRLEDRMEAVRRAGRVDGTEDLPLLFRGLETLERMVSAVRDSGEAPPGDPELLAVLEGAAGGAPKKARG
jgi:two-component system chemotaxis sensor kinase CheA